MAEGAEGFEKAIDRLLASGPDRESIDRVRVPLLAASTGDAMVAQVVGAIRPWLGDSGVQAPDRRLDAIGGETPRAAAWLRSRTTSHWAMRPAGASSWRGCAARPPGQPHQHRRAGFR